MACCNLIADKIKCIRVEWGPWIWMDCTRLLTRIGYAQSRCQWAKKCRVFLFILTRGALNHEVCCGLLVLVYKTLLQGIIFVTKNFVTLFANAPCSLAINCPSLRLLSILPFFLCPFFLIFALLYGSFSSILFPILSAFYLISRSFPLTFFLLLFIISSFWFVF
jgi:hypothetical protein